MKMNDTDTQRKKKKKKKKKKKRRSHSYMVTHVPGEREREIHPQAWQRHVCTSTYPIKA